MPKDILLLPHNHFDPTWRRCFDRVAEKDGVKVRSYAEIEEHCINAWLALAPRGYTFFEGQAAVWRKYLQRNPQKIDELQDLAREGNLLVMQAGETVQDSVMPAAEGLVRNFLVAKPFLDKFVGADHPGLKLAWLEDAFGNGPNYPQILRGVGAEVACRTSYMPCPESVWVGIDGTRIYHLDTFPRVRTGTWEYIPPCPLCRGDGCDECDDTGLDMVTGFNMDWVPSGIESAFDHEADCLVVACTTEEGLPDEKLPPLVDELNAKHAGEGSVRFATPLDEYRAHLPALEAAGRQRDDTPTVDLNPAMPGCMVTRIRMKQRVRSVSYKLLAAEADLATAAWRDDSPVAPPEQFADAWRNVAFCQFHDAITGTHIDSAYAELMDMLDAAEAVADRYLPTPPAEAKEQFSPAAESPIDKQLGELTVEFDLKGIRAIRGGGDEDVFGAAPAGHRKRRPLRIAELVMETDFGGAWAKRIPEWSGPQSDTSLIPLGDYHHAVEVAATAIRWTGRYTGGDPKVRKLDWAVTARPSGDGKRLNFVTDVDWDTGSRRLRVVVPVASKEDSAVYEVPFGFIERKFDASGFSYAHMKANLQEYPALHWVAKTVGPRSGAALLNKGLPCNRWMPGRLDLSLLRSPEWEFCTVLPGNYEFWDNDGLRDAGRHRFEYSLWPYYDGLTPGDLTRAGYAYNLPAAVAPPFDVAGDVVPAAWKLAEDGEGWILRLQEAGGRGTTVSLTLPRACTITQTDLLERPQGDGVCTDRFETLLHKHGILTLRIQ